MTDAPYRIAFIGHDISTWETSSIERLDQLTPDQLHSPLRLHDWMITTQGSLPTPLTVSEQQVLPRLKLAVLPPSFDFTKLRQQLVEMKTTTHESDCCEDSTNDYGVSYIQAWNDSCGDSEFQNDV